MSILSDKEIIELCTPPKFVTIKNVGGENIRELVPHSRLPRSSIEYENFVNNYNLDITNADDIKDFKPFISPFIPHQIKERPDPANPFKTQRIISYGLSSYSYDFRVAPEFLIFTNTNSVVVDPLEIDEKAFVKVEGDKCIIPPNSFVLARTIEYFKMPEDVTGILYPKSTYARTGNLLFPTVIEAGWEGQITLEYANTTPLPIVLHANMGGGAIVFHRGNECITPYNARNGKYMGQMGITLPKV